jgi:hypothetical protein
MSEVGYAAKFRVFHREALATGGLRVRKHARRLDDLWRRTDFLYRAGSWHDWFKTSYYHRLLEAVEHFAAKGITIRDIQLDLGAALPRPLTRAQDHRLRHGVQRAARRVLGAPRRQAVEVRLRTKLARWPMTLFPRLRAARAAAAAARLRRLVAPQVLSAATRLWMNGWCSRRRFQGYGPCIFGCRYGEDAIDHYCQCTKLHDYGCRRLRLPRAPDLDQRATSFMLLEPRSALPDDRLVRRALLVTAAYRLHYLAQHGQPLNTDPEYLQRALDQAVKEAALGHPRAMQTLDSIWVR